MFILVVALESAKQFYQIHIFGTFLQHYFCWIMMPKQATLSKICDPITIESFFFPALFYVLLWNPLDVLEYV